VVSSTQINGKKSTGPDKENEKVKDSRQKMRDIFLSQCNLTIAAKDKK
jgi:hypothetical protein